jgi:hypothetical protein
MKRPVTPLAWFLMTTVTLIWVGMLSAVGYAAAQRSRARR